MKRPNRTRTHENGRSFRRTLKTTRKTGIDAYETAITPLAIAMTIIRAGVIVPGRTPRISAPSAIASIGTTISAASAAAGARTRGARASPRRQALFGAENASSGVRRSRRLFVTTKSELKTIAPAATIGLRRP
jgi:hypothetical protein